MSLEQKRHDISDDAWEKIKPHTIGEKRTRGGKTKDTRQFINGVFWILRTGTLWKDKGIWENILTALIDDADF